MGDDAGAIPDVITRYFAAQSARDLDAIVGLFADDGVLIDEGQIRRGTEQIRDWRDNVAAVCEYTTEVRGVDRVAEGQYVRAFGSKAISQAARSTCAIASLSPATRSIDSRLRHDVPSLVETRIRSKPHRSMACENLRPALCNSRRRAL